MSATGPLRREEMSVETHLGLYEGGDGQRAHGLIDRLDRHGALREAHARDTDPLK